MALHYAFGAATGAAYGAAAEVLPSLTAGAGFPFGGAVWLAADEVVTPALGLSKKPTEYFHRTSAAIEVLIFMVARKMVNPNISGLELLLGAAALAGLIVVRFYFLPGKPR